MSIAEIQTIISDDHHSLKIQDVRHHASCDPEYQQLCKVIVEGFPDHLIQLPESCRPYWIIREHLSIDDDLIVHGYHLLIPSAMHSQVLSDLHKSHQGTVCTKQCACLTVYWPAWTMTLTTWCSTFHPILESPSQARQPSHPFQEITVNFCCYGGQTYLIIVDCFTDWPDIIPMGHNTTSSDVLRKSFCCNSRYTLVRQRPIVYFQIVSKPFPAMGFSSQDFITPLSTK